MKRIMSLTATVQPPTSNLKPKQRSIPLSACFLLSALFSLNAAVPLRWTVETSRLQPVVFDVVRGETLALEASFKSYGTPLQMTNLPCCVFWQTNGMGNVWWTASASATEIAPSVVSADFTPQMDPGAPVVTGFIGSTGEIYRAAFTLRFRHGPGASPNAIPLPAKTIDCAQVEFLNPDAAPWHGGGGSSGTDTNAVQSIIRRNVETNYLCTADAAQAMTSWLRDKTDMAVYVAADWSYDPADIQTYSKLVWTERSSGRGWYLNGPRETLVSTDYNATDLTYSCTEGTVHATRASPVVTNGEAIATSGSVYAKAEIDGTSVTNGGAVVAATNNAKAYADATFRTLADNVCHSDSFSLWRVKSSPPEVSFPLGSQPVFGEVTWHWIDSRGLPEGWWESDWTVTGNETLVALHNKANTVVIERTNVSTAGQPFVTYDNVPSTNGLVTASVATNAAEAVFSANADYALTNCTGASFALSSGQIGNVTLTAEQPALSVTLDFSAADNRSGDCLLYLVNGTNVVLGVGNEDVTPVGDNANELKAGTNLVMFTRLKREGNKSIVLVSTKEVK